MRSFNLKQEIFCIVFQNTLKLRFMAQTYSTKAQKNWLLRNTSVLWRGLCLFYLPVSYSWLKRLKMSIFSTKEARLFRLLEKNMVDLLLYPLTRKKQCEIFSIPEFGSLMELRDSFAASRVFNLFFNWPLFYIRQIIKKNKKDKLLT